MTVETDFAHLLYPFSEAVYVALNQSCPSASVSGKTRPTATTRPAPSCACPQLSFQYSMPYFTTAMDLVAARSASPPRSRLLTAIRVVRIERPCTRSPLTLLGVTGSSVDEAELWALCEAWVPVPESKQP